MCPIWVQPEEFERKKDPIGFRGGANLYAYAGNAPTNFIDPSGLKPKDPFQCAADNADKVSLAGVAHSLGVPEGGAAGFAADALGGNAFSGLTTLGERAFSSDGGIGGKHSLGWDAAQTALAGPTQGLGPAVEALRSATGEDVVFQTLFNGSVTTESLQGADDVVTDAIAKGVGNALESGGELTTLAGEASTAGLTGAEYATGFGELKLGYDAATYGLALFGCWANII